MDDRSSKTRLGRRGFLRSTGAATVVGSAGGAVIGAGVGHLFAETEVEWVQGTAGPDAAATLTVRRPPGAPPSDATLEVVVKTPQGVERASVERVRLAAGESAIDVVLRYPFADFVHGTYSYHVRLNLGGHVVQTAKPIRYKVEPFLWFS